MRYLGRRFRFIREAPKKYLFLSTWEASQTLLLDDEIEMNKSIRDLEVKMQQTLQERDIHIVINTRKGISEWMEKYATEVDRLNGEQRAEVYRKYGTHIDRLKTHLLQLYKIRD
jgi:predicted Zn-dependent protease